MNNCKTDKDLLILAANNEISWVKKTKVLLHIRRCKECRDYYLEHKKISELFKELPDYGASDLLAKKIEKRTGVKASEPSVLEDLLSVIFYSRVKFAGVISVIVVVIIVVALFRSNSTAPDRSIEQNYFTTAEIKNANYKTREALAILGKFLNKTSVQIEADILGDKVSKPLNKGINTINEIFNKGENNEKD